MKKLVLSVFCCLSLIGISQDDKTWRVGITWGAHGNHNKYSGGSSDANARFHHDKFGGGSFGIVARYDYNHHWMWLSGLNITSFGFEYSIAENYSLLNPKNRFTSIKSEYTAFEIPGMVHYKFNPNCNNARWVIGAGFVQTFTGKQTLEKSISQVADANSSNVNYLSSTSTAKGGNYWMLRWAVSREKMYKRGSILSAALVFNIGFHDLAHSTVNYTIDNKNYNHEFTNNGSFVGFRLSYFFKPINSWKSVAKRRAASTSTVTK